jgi:hypothetical protein
MLGVLYTNILFLRYADIFLLIFHAHRFWPVHFFPQDHSNPGLACVQQRGIILWWIVFIVVDPDLDPHGSALIWSARSGSGSRRAKMAGKSSEEISCFEVLF